MHYWNKKEVYKTIYKVVKNNIAFLYIFECYLH